eukprot:CAMPEP_0170588316 /NCGR_PEP_ID=MMETSP0224-20130122/10764_1 /TAXON_ID=285029 /ORGANISM="Togula jolla, Strain CCCM 725" /LENGTH=184 /DNA_ID=CAMNT_0010912023 /DNA_START=1370 /DNA_END=1922 /DNA_ORIENTATION=-
MGHTVDTSCAKVSLVHHILAMILGLFAHWQYREQILEEASFRSNDETPYAVILQHFNIGYFLYDSVHVARSLGSPVAAAHVIALLGYTTSEMANVFALANAVNTWVTELGSLMYSLYLVLKTPVAYKAFVGLYTLSRIYFAIWSCTVLLQVRRALLAPPGHFPFWAPYCAALLQILLLGVNVAF